MPTQYCNKCLISCYQVVEGLQYQRLLSWTNPASSSLRCGRPWFLKTPSTLRASGIYELPTFYFLLKIWKLGILTVWTLRSCEVVTATNLRALNIFTCYFKGDREDTENGLVHMDLHRINPLHQCLNQHTSRIIILSDFWNTTSDHGFFLHPWVSCLKLWKSGGKQFVQISCVKFWLRKDN